MEIALYDAHRKMLVCMHQKDHMWQYKVFMVKRQITNNVTSDQL